MAKLGNRTLSPSINVFFVYQGIFLPWKSYSKIRKLDFSLNKKCIFSLKHVHFTYVVVLFINISVFFFFPLKKF